MKTMKRISALLVVLLLLFSLAAPVFAADSGVTYKGHRLFQFNPGSEYTLTDLFDNFKGVMPGDVLRETVTVTNKAYCCDYIDVYLRAEAHDDTANPLGAKVAETETVASMTDFLSQLHMTVTNRGEVLFDASPDEEAGLSSNVFLGRLREGYSLELEIVLTVPTSLGNEYANRVGEVDWVFVVEERDDTTPPPETEPPVTEPPETEPTPDTEPTPETEPTPDTEPAPETEPTPDTEPVPETEPTPDTEPVPETEPTPDTEPAPETEPIPEREPGLPQTGLLWWPVVVLSFFGILMIAIGILMKRRQETDEK